MERVPLASGLTSRGLMATLACMVQGQALIFLAQPDPALGDGEEVASDSDLASAF